MNRFLCNSQKSVYVLSNVYIVFEIYDTNGYQSVIFYKIFKKTTVRLLPFTRLNKVSPRIHLYNLKCFLCFYVVGNKFKSWKLALKIWGTWTSSISTNCPICSFIPTKKYSLTKFDFARSRAHWDPVSQQGASWPQKYGICIHIFDIEQSFDNDDFTHSSNVVKSPWIIF